MIRIRLKGAKDGAPGKASMREAVDDDGPPASGDAQRSSLDGRSTWHAITSMVSAWKATWKTAPPEAAAGTAVEELGPPLPAKDDALPLEPAPAPPLPPGDAVAPQLRDETPAQPSWSPAAI